MTQAALPTTTDAETGGKAKPGPAVGVPPTARLVHLDFLRGLAALIVTAGHARHFLFETFANLSASGHGLSLGWKLFYFVTGLSHEAVIAFFALSGFLVGGKVLGDLGRDRFSWPLFLLRRMTRLWIVIIPALLLTLAIDGLGSRVSGSPLYEGSYFGIYSSGPEKPADHGVATFFGNVFFVQQIFVPVFGTNTPIWSLANEFWYYILFTALFWSVHVRRSRMVLIGLAVVAAVMSIIPTTFRAGGAVWVAGALAAWVSRRGEFKAVLSGVTAGIASLALIGAGLVLSKVYPEQVGDLGLGLLIAAGLPGLARMRVRTGPYAFLARWLSELSYTLYLTHMPLLLAIVAVTMAPIRAVPGPGQFALFAVLMMVSMAWAYVVWLAFERQTDRVYGTLSQGLRA